jgi:transposase-like protein
MFDITNPIFADADKAREYLEAQRWPNGPVCPHCGAENEATRLKGKSTRPGVYKCKPCQKPFTVTVGTVFERSKVPLNKWLLVSFLMASSKKGVSAHQIHRMLKLSYKTAWFVCHRIRTAMGLKPEDGAGPIGGENKTIEADETFVGGKKKNVHKGKPEPKKHVVMALVERDGEVRVRHLPDVTAKNLRNVLVTQASRKSYLMTDEAPAYKSVGKEFSGHGSVNHSADEYVRGMFWHTNTAESFFALLKRGVFGSFHSVSEQHLQRYADEFAFRFNYRKVTDAERTDAVLRAIGGKRLTYRRTDRAAHA